MVLGKSYPSVFKGSGLHGIQSADQDASDDKSAFIFEGDVMGCENGWTGFRDSCYFIPIHNRDNDDDNEDSLSWDAAQAKCKTQFW